MKENSDLRGLSGEFDLDLGYTMPYDRICKVSSSEETQGHIFSLRDLRRRILCISFLYKEVKKAWNQDSFLQHKMLQQKRHKQSLLWREAFSKIHRKNDGSSESSQIPRGKAESKFHSIWNGIWVQGE